MLYCVECGCCSGELGKGWVAFRCDEPDPDEGDAEPGVAVYLPAVRGSGVRVPAGCRRDVRVRVGATAERNRRLRSLPQPTDRFPGSGGPRAFQDSSVGRALGSSRRSEAQVGSEGRAAEAQGDHAVAPLGAACARSCGCNPPVARTARYLRLTSASWGITWTG